MTRSVDAPPHPDNSQPRYERKPKVTNPPTRSSEPPAAGQASHALRVPAAIGLPVSPHSQLAPEKFQVVLTAVL